MAWLGLWIVMYRRIAEGVYKKHNLVYTAKLVFSLVLTVMVVVMVVVVRSLAPARRVFRSARRVLASELPHRQQPSSSSSSSAPAPISFLAFVVCTTREHQSPQCPRSVLSIFTFHDAYLVQPGQRLTRRVDRRDRAHRSLHPQTSCQPHRQVCPGV